MDSRELYPSDEQRRRIMDFIMAAGETLLGKTEQRSSGWSRRWRSWLAASICGSSTSTC